MTGFAKRTQVLVSVSAAVIEGADMMDFIGGNVKSTLKARLAEGILGDVQVTNLTPTMVVVFWIAMFTVVLAGNDSLVEFAVTAAPSSLGATRIFAGFKRFEGDIFAHKKSPLLRIYYRLCRLNYYYYSFNCIRLPIFFPRFFLYNKLEKSESR